MKTHRFELARYFDSESSDNIYIDWPCVHRQAGLHHIQWLQSQTEDQCQLVMERKENDPYCYIVAEIYSDKLASLYSLLWAK
jgi:hypothetical protein